MGSEKLKFRCKHCSKLLAVSSQHAGRTLACPACKNQIQVPAGSTAPLTSTTPTRPPAAAPLASAQPLSRPSQPKPAPLNRPSALNRPGPGQPLSNQTPPGAGGAPPPYPRPGQAAAANQFGQSAYPTGSPAAARGHRAAPRSNMGGMIGGLLLASFVASICTIAWLLVAAFTGMELGILAWGIGGLIGLIAGLLGRSSSPVYCGLTAMIAVGSVLAAKVIMALFVMLAHIGSDFIADMQQFSPELMKQKYALADQMLADGEFEGTEKAYAELYLAEYFSEADTYEQITDEMHEISDAFDQRVRDELKTKTDAEREQLVEAARSRHPEWIEDRNLYLALVEQLVVEEGALSAEQTGFAKSQLYEVDESFHDEEYTKSISENDISKAKTEVRATVVQRLQSMNAEQRDQAIRETIKRHPVWNPFPDAHIALMAKMHDEGAFTGKLAEHAKQSSEYQFGDEYSEDYFDKMSDEEYEKREKELTTSVNTRLVDLDKSARETLVAKTKAKHPDWYGDELSMDEEQEELEKALDEIGGDRTFIGSLLSVFGWMDLLWIFLGASTAYATASKYGTEDT